MCIPQSGMVHTSGDVISTYSEEPHVADENREIDGVLALLVTALNSMPDRCEDGPPLTLTVQGLLISGKVIPDWEWFEDVEQLCKDTWVASGGPDTGNQGWAEFFKMGKKGMLQGRSEARAVQGVIQDLAQRYRDALLDVDRPTYIHLRDARAFPASGASPIPTAGTYWRGRLADVSGWWFGTLTVDPDDDSAA